MENFCANCGASNPADAKHCGECGVPLEIAVPVRARNWKLIGIIAALLLVIGLLALGLFAKPEIASQIMGTADEAAPTAKAEPVERYTIATANVRDKPSTSEGLVTSTLPRGSLVTGLLKASEDAREWLELADGKGFVATSNLSETEPPRLARVLGDKSWVSDGRYDIYGMAADAGIVATVTSGTRLTLSGLTTQGALEVKLKDGSFGYIRNAAPIILRLDAKPIAIAFNPSTCNFGGEIGALFERISARSRAEYDAADQREYPTEEARNTALGRLEGRSNYQRLERNFNGLLLTGVGLHYESQSLYFADPPARVIEAFRGKGFRIDRSGNFPSSELYAGIAAAQGDARRYGVTDLGCGV